MSKVEIPLVEGRNPRCLLSVEWGHLNPGTQWAVCGGEQWERELFRYHVADVRNNEAFDGPFIALDGSFSCHFCSCLLLAGCSAAGESCRSTCFKCPEVK